MLNKIIIAIITFGISYSNCIDGDINNEDPCNPLECWNGEWYQIVIDCAEEMGIPCENGYYIPPEEGECCSTCVENSIEGRWNPAGFNNTMYEFVYTEVYAEAGLRYTYYCPNGNGCDETYWNSLDTSDGIPNPNPYSVSADGNTLSINLFFGNIATYELGFRCDGQVVDFYYDEDDWAEGLHSTMYRLGFDDFDNECLEPNIDDCLCNEMWDPVCGVDGNTYSNACYAECEYVIISYEGECIVLDECLWLNESECENAEGCQWEGSDNTPGGGSCIEIETYNCSDLNESNCEQTEGCQWQESDNVPGGGFCVEIQTTNCSDIAYQEACESYGCTWNESDNLPGGGGCFEGQGGDINSDNLLNVLDVVGIVNFVLGVTLPSESQFISADLNFDGELNVLDIVSLVNSILGFASLNVNDDVNATLYKNELTTKGLIGGIQFTGELISNLNGDDIIASNYGKSIIYNLNGTLKTKVFTFDNDPDDLIVSSSTAQKVNIVAGSPLVFKLNEVYPNPFKPSTTISYLIDRNTNINISIYNMVGEKVSELVNTKQAAGEYSVSWEANNQPSGLYLVMLSAGNQIKTQKIMLVK